MSIELRKYDIVCAFQVLEHIENPVSLSGWWRHQIARNGIIAIEVPSLTDPLLTVFDCPEYRRFFYHEAHRWYFSPTSLAKLMDVAGFEGEIIYHQDYNYLNALHWVHTGKPQPTCHEGLGPPMPEAPIMADFVQTADKAYKTTLTALRKTENITFIGRLK
jgi:hypothetical protein